MECREREKEGGRKRGREERRSVRGCEKGRGREETNLQEYEDTGIDQTVRTGVLLPPDLL